MQSFFQREEDHSPLPLKHYERRLPLAKGERRERDPDRDPQLLWNGISITLTEAQRRQLMETGKIEIGEAQLVWHGKDTQDCWPACRRGAAPRPALAWMPAPLRKLLRQ